VYARFGAYTASYARLCVRFCVGMCLCKEYVIKYCDVMKFLKF